MTSKQKKALEKITGKSWNIWDREAVGVFFAYTDRGERTELFSKVWRTQKPGFEFNRIEQDLWDLIEAHTNHAWTIELWKEDFRKGLLFLSDFEGCPNAYKEHAREIYDSVM